MCHSWTLGWLPPRPQPIAVCSPGVGICLYHLVFIAEDYYPPPALPSQFLELVRDKGGQFQWKEQWTGLLGTPILKRECLSPRKLNPNPSRTPARGMEGKHHWWSVDSCFGGNSPFVTPKTGAGLTRVDERSAWWNPVCVCVARWAVGWEHPRAMLMDHCLRRSKAQLHLRMTTGQGQGKSNRQMAVNRWAGQRQSISLRYVGLDRHFCVRHSLSSSGDTTS